ncbi:tetratricopeptide repeat protein [Ferruginibacter profundus]
MNKIKAALFFLTTMLVVNFVNAQSIEEGKKFFYYEKYKSAKGVFEKLVAANPNNVDAVYWLGQTMIAPDDNKDIAGAKELYRKTLEANSNSALLTAGMGHIELLEGKTQDARNRFETAISLSQGKSIPVLNAIGLANGDFNIKNGDGAYAVEKLKLATTLKGFKDPETYCLLGDAYRKLADGGGALTAYQNALTLDPKYARAKYRIGKIYLTQGITQQDIYMQYFNDAIALDANYTPVYYTLYDVYYKTNVVKAGEYLEKYLVLMGEDEPQACYFRTTIKYAQGLFAETVTQAESCIASAGTNADPRLYGLIGYAKDKMNDSTGAKSAFEKFFQFQKPEKIGPTDYETYSKILLKFPGNEALAGTYINKAVEADSTEAGKVTLLKSVAVKYEAQKNYGEAANWYKRIVDLKKVPTKTDVFNAGYSYYRSGNPQASIDVFNIYTQKFPDDVLGFYWVGKASWVIDTTMTLAMANPAFEKVIQLGEPMTDKSKIKTQLMTAYKYMIIYDANIKKDKPGALDYTDRAFLLDSTDVDVKNYKVSIPKLNMNAAPAKPKTNTPPTPPVPPAKPATTKPATGTTVPKANSTKAAPAKKK